MVLFDARITSHHLFNDSQWYEVPLDTSRIRIEQLLASRLLIMSPGSLITSHKRMT